MFDLKLLRRRSEPLPIIQSDRDHCQVSKSDTSTTNSLSHDPTFNTDQTAHMLTMPASLCRRKYLQRTNHWVKDTTTTSNTTDNLTDAISQESIQSTTNICHNNQLGTDTTNYFHRSIYHDIMSNSYYLLKSNHQLELIQSKNNSTNFFFILASQIRGGGISRQNIYHQQLWTHKEEVISGNAKKGRLKQTRNTDIKCTKEMQSSNISDYKHPIHDAVYDSSSNFLLHCMTIDECYNKVESILNNPDAISSSPLNKEIDSETLTRATPISERGKNDTTTVIPYERIQFTKKRKNDNIPNSGIIPQEINRHKFHKYRKYVNQPLKLTTTTTRMNGTRKRPDPFA
uniref:SJCHGC06045 protein n=1 Tax=Schistosoma japonicum TaxID=6182 RepID=Q5DAS5_SCHJA|nr:SJCHGC06045 protein [Schistosoma japonicum]